MTFIEWALETLDNQNLSAKSRFESVVLELATGCDEADALWDRMCERSPVLARYNVKYRLIRHHDTACEKEGFLNHLPKLMQQEQLGIMHWLRFMEKAIIREIEVHGKESGKELLSNCLNELGKVDPIFQDAELREAIETRINQSFD